MPDLAQLQAEMTAAILAGDRSSLAPNLTHADRLSIYRNNTFISLSAALKATFPVTVKLADERFFGFAAHRFIAAHPPREARLSVYGAEFPAFLRRFAPCRGFPLIAAMAQLEWAIAEALHAPDEQALPAGELTSLASARSLELQPSLRFVLARYPLLDVWRSHRSDRPEVHAPLKRKTSRILLHRRGDDIHFAELDAARFAFLRRLALGHDLEAAATGALLRDPLFDLAGEIVSLIRGGLVIGLHVYPPYH
jgi:hypothetical protein